MRIPTTYDMDHRHWVTLPNGRRGMGQELPLSLPPLPANLANYYVSTEACNQRAAGVKDTWTRYAIAAGVGGWAVGWLIGYAVGKK